MYPNSRRFLKEYLRGHGKEYFIGITSLLVTIAAAVSIPAFISDCMDLLSHSTGNTDDSILLDSQTREQLLIPALSVIALAIFMGIARTLSRIFIFLPGRRIEAQVRQDFFEAVVTLPAESINEFQSGDLISRGTNDISSIRVMVSMGILHCINSSAMLISCLSLMLSTNSRLTLICLIPVPVTVLITRFFSSRMMRKAKITQAKLGELSEGVREQFRAHSLLATFPVFGIVHQKFQAKNSFYRKAAEQLMSNRVFMIATILTTNSLALFLLIYVGGQEAINGGKFSIGDLVSFIIYLGMLQGPLQALGWLLPIFQRGEVCLKRVYEIRDAAINAATSEKDKDCQSIEQLNEYNDTELLHIKNLKFHYDQDNGKQFELSIDDLTLKHGKSYGLFGSTGSGKSTLAMLLSGNLTAQEGEIYFNGHPYSHIHKNLISRIFSLVPQECRHFSGQLKSNLETAQYPDQDRKAQVCDFETAYRTSRMQQDIEMFPKAFESIICEHGLNLSGGQRQRLAIFRALLKPRQVLIMDDFVSAIDHTTEEALLHELNKPENETRLLISHRISALLECDEILIMEEGRILHRGTHEQLLEQYAPYKKTFDYQLLENELEDLT